MDKAKSDRLSILLTGATGYVGGRLLKRLEDRGCRLRCLTRHPELLKPRVRASTEIVQGDVLNEDSLRRAMAGIDTAYYLVHSMAGGGQFEEQDRQAASIFASAAKICGVRRMIYLGGLGQGPDLSAHLASRQEVGRILRQSGIPTIEFRASIIIGSGSLSFEMIRSLVERLPIMTTPRWVSVEAQPIAIEDVLAYLLAAIDLPDGDEGIYEIGGPDRASYLDIMREYARQRGLRRTIIRVPVLTPGLSGLWLTLVTPLYARIGRQLIEGLRNTTVVTDDQALRVFNIRPRGLSEAIERARVYEDRAFAETRWSDASWSGQQSKHRVSKRSGSRLIDSRSAIVPYAPADAFEPIQRIGGDRGWYFADFLWRLRGLIDLLAGGVGVRRGRRHPVDIAAGDTLDFWRVEAFEADRLLRLRAEMRVPGRAWLQFEVDPNEHGAMIRQTAMFDPLGVWGLAYWWLLYPIHCVVFAGMLRGIVQQIDQNRRDANRACKTTRALTP